MTLHVYSPLPGTVLPLSDVPDPVFSASLVGAGLAIEPTGSDDIDVVSTISGKILKLHPHAAIIVTPEKQGILVHIGIDTVGKPELFTILATEGEQVEVGTPLIRYNPAKVSERGLSPVVPVVLMDSKPEAITLVASGEVATGESLFTQ